MKQLIELIKELRKTPRGKGILFFAVYFLLFAILFLIIQFSDNTGNYEKDYELGRPYSFDISNLEADNYHFEYTITKDNTKYLYVGDRNDNKEKFIFNNKEYYYDGNKYYVDDKEVDNPYLYPEFKEIDQIEELLSIATYESKTSYESGTTKYNFLLSSNTINELINNKQTDIEEEPNSITISNDGDGIINEITYHLNSYCKSEETCKDKLEINLSYSKFGEIKEIVND